MLHPPLPLHPDVSSWGGYCYPWQLSERLLPWSAGHGYKAPYPGLAFKVTLAKMTLHAITKIYGNATTGVMCAAPGSVDAEILQVEGAASLNQSVGFAISHAQVGQG